MYTADLLTRRGFLAACGSGVASALLPDAGAAAVLPGCMPEPKRYAPNPQIAVSLKQLMAALTDCNDGGMLPVTAKCRELRRMGGLTRLDGFVVDAASQDIVLWGISEKSVPPLDIEDFIVACRAAYGVYGRRDGNRILISAPAISIDPNPSYHDQLMSLKGDDYDSAEWRRRFETLARAPQAVRVEGMPRHTRVAKILVEADYRMKMVNQGHVKLPIATRFPSVQEARVAFATAALHAGRRSPLGAVSTRYWFAPGSFEYQISTARDTIFLSTASVVLLDEDNLTTSGGQIPSGRVNEISRAYTCAWSQRMEDIYAAEPIWRDMHNIFRHFAVAKIMASIKAFETARFDSRFLLDTYEVELIRLPDTLPGLSRIDVVKVEGWTSFQTVWGGVSLDVDNVLTEDQSGGSVSPTQRRITAARPGPGAITWTIG